MKKLTIILSAFIVFASFTTLTPWKGDKAHSQLAFTVTHLGVSDVTGTFNDFDVVATATKDDFSDAVFELAADVASIDTRVEARDKHLKSPDFFDAAKYPKLTFKSTSLKSVGKDNYILTGNLSLHGVTKEVTMDLVYRGTTDNPMSKARTAGFKLTGSINRSDFNVGNNFPAAIISDKVSIEADGEFVKN